MLAYNLDGTWVSWSGEAVNGVMHPSNIEQLWSTQELEDKGFKQIISEPIPSDKEATAWVLEDVNGVPTKVPALRDKIIPIPEVISDRQFFQQLAVQGVITEDEALAAVGPGTLPDALIGLVKQLPQEQQFPANMLLKGAVQFHRNHPMVSVIGQAFGWKDSQIDALWIAAYDL